MERGQSDAARILAQRGCLTVQLAGLAKVSRIFRLPHSIKSGAKYRTYRCCKVRLIWMVVQCHSIQCCSWQRGRRRPIVATRPMFTPLHSCIQAPGSVLSSSLTGTQTLFSVLLRQVVQGPDPSHSRPRPGSASERNYVCVSMSPSFDETLPGSIKTVTWFTAIDPDGSMGL